LCYPTIGKYAAKMPFSWIWPLQSASKTDGSLVAGTFKGFLQTENQIIPVHFNLLVK